VNLPHKSDWLIGSLFLDQPILFHDQQRCSSRNMLQLALDEIMFCIHAISIKKSSSAESSYCIFSCCFKAHSSWLDLIDCPHQHCVLPSFGSTNLKIVFPPLEMCCNAIVFRSCELREEEACFALCALCFHMGKLPLRKQSYPNHNTCWKMLSGALRI